MKIQITRKLPSQIFSFAAIALICLVASQGVNAMSPIHSSFHEEKYVAIGGVDQWITIKGTNRDKPVVLFLHGGPGDALSPFADAMFAGWDKDFTLVQWDQRGAGRTYSRNKSSSDAMMTIERMTQDGVQVAEYLTRHLGKKKIILVGGSWGSVLGVDMVQTRPDLFYAYIGNAQIVDWWEDVAASYARVMELAQAAADAKSVSALKEIGAPPWKSIRTFAKFRKVEQIYQEKLITAAFPPQAINPMYASARERDEWAAADDSSFMHFVGLDMSGPLAKVNLPAQGTSFSIPIFIVQGTEDLTASPNLARAYFDEIKAPVKRFYLVPGTGHEPSAASLAMDLQILIKQVGPLTVN